jgi:hypothetical protein
MHAEPPPIAYYALCRDSERQAAWRARAADVPGVDFRLLSGFSSIYAFIQAAVADCRDDWLVVAHDDIVIGRDFAARARAAVNEAQASFPNWGVIGNAGVDLDRHFSAHVQDPWCRPERALGPRVVATVDGNLVIIHRRAWQQAGLIFPDLGGFHGYDVVMGLLCVRHGLLPLVDGRLVVVHHSGGNRGVYARYIQGPVFQGWFSQHFSDSEVPTLLGFHPKQGGQASTATGRLSIQNFQDQALQRSRGQRPWPLYVVAAQGVDVPPLPDPWHGAIELRRLDATGWQRLLQDAQAALAGDASKPGHVWFLPAGSRPEVSALSGLARAVLKAPGALVVAGHRLGDGSTAAPFRPPSALWPAVFSGERFPAAALVVPVCLLSSAAVQQAVRAPEGAAQAGLQVPDDGMLLAAACLAHGQRATLCLQQCLVAVAPPHEARSGHGAVGGYGSTQEWDRIDRLAQRDALLGTTAGDLWRLAAAVHGAPEPPREVLWAQSVGQVAYAARRVLKEPRRYLGRAFALLWQNLRRGDWRGLVREARQFRPR